MNDELQCSMCKHFLAETKRCKKRKLLEPEQLKPCKYYDNYLYKMFVDFLNTEWLDDHYYMTTDFTDRFNISRHLARHYLYEILTLQEHRLFRVKKYNKAYYIERDVNDELLKMAETIPKIEVEK